MNDISAPFLWLAIQKQIQKEKSQKSSQRTSSKKKKTNSTLQNSFTSVGSTQIDLE